MYEMGSRGKLLFDLNKLPGEDDEENDRVICSQPQKVIASASSSSPDFFPAAARPQEIVNNHAFSHASSVSGFQPFVRFKASHNPQVSVEKPKEDDASKAASSLASETSNGKEVLAAFSMVPDSAGAETTEREEGECTDADVSMNEYANSNSGDKNIASQDIGLPEIVISQDGKVVSSNSALSGSDQDPNSTLQAVNNSHSSEINNKGDMTVAALEEPGLMGKQKEVRGVEASHALKCANNIGKRKMDQQKEAMLGKRRHRQTMFLNLEDVKQAGAIKTSTPRRQNFPQPVITRTLKEVRPTQPSADVGEKQAVTKEQGLYNPPSGEGVASEPETRSDSNGELYSGILGKPRKTNGNTNPSLEVPGPSVPRQSSWKQPIDPRQPKSTVFSSRSTSLIGQNLGEPKLGGKKLPPPKKAIATGMQYQDTSVERLIREVTNEKFWHHPEDTELERVPGRFESVEDYVRVFEPLLFEECRAQLYSTWEELTEANAYTKVRIKCIEKRERGWYDVILLSVNDSKWTFKEGDVAVLSYPIESDEERQTSGRVAGTVRRHIPIDTRDPPGAILHFYVGDSYDISSKIDDNHILRKLKPKDIWHLTVLGSLATTQREYVALHAFSRLNPQMQTAILKPSPEQFPDYEHQTPAMPECFTQSFVDHLHRSFNAPQLAAIHWAAMHTAAGTTGGTKRQDPWPFTLVQGPPGTGKTHTVWGMLNVIHLVQYQHYYTSLLKKLAPESYKQAAESNSDNVVSGSIDEVLQNMDQNLFRTLPKLCPKPRMLVCAPSNAATDELLARVLDRGFIDGEMKQYRPDVARVGVDSQTRAAQAVSVERRTEQLLSRSREEILGHMHYLRSRENAMSQHIAYLKKELSAAAVATRSQGSVGVDPDILVAREQNRDALLQNLAAAVEARDKVLVEMSRLLIVEGKFRAGNNFNLEEARANLEASFANEAEIVFTTVSSSGRKLFSRLTHGFDMVVIDEAAQASEVAVLPPLSLGAARCVLVGDPQQLPATVISKAAGTLFYSRSLFERFQQAGCSTLLLTVQYRMHPQIRDFPSRYFYQDRLIDSESVINLPDEIYYKDPLLRPYLFFDISHGRESHRGGSVSYENVDEARFCLGLYLHLQKTLKSIGSGRVTVGIVTPYKLQLKCLKHEFGNLLSQEEFKDLYINTVDAFQGQERDVIIMSCVRASGHGVGFVADVRRMNVALTRARRALWVMGNANSLMKSDDWAALIKDAKSRNCFIEMESLPKDFSVPKGPSTHPQGKAPSNLRGFRSSVPRARSFDVHAESRSGMPSEDDGFTRNGNYRPFKPPPENSLDDFDQSIDKFRDAWQHGVQRRQNTTRSVGKRDS